MSIMSMEFGNQARESLENTVASTKYKENSSFVSLIRKRIQRYIETRGFLLT